jgi:hypothetical protein
LSRSTVSASGDSGLGVDFLGSACLNQQLLPRLQKPDNMELDVGDVDRDRMNGTLVPDA